LTKVTERISDEYGTFAILHEYFIEMGFLFKWEMSV